MSVFNRTCSWHFCWSFVTIPVKRATLDECRWELLGVFEPLKLWWRYSEDQLTVFQRRWATRWPPPDPECWSSSDRTNPYGWTPRTLSSTRSRTRKRKAPTGSVRQKIVMDDDEVKVCSLLCCSTCHVFPKRLKHFQHFTSPSRAQCPLCGVEMT